MKKLPIFASVALLAAISWLYWSSINTYEHQFEDLLVKVEKGQLSDYEKSRVDLMLVSDNPEKIRQGISIAMMYKNPTWVSETDLKFRSFITHKDADVRSGALLGLYKLKSPYFKEAYSVIELDQEGLVQNAKDLLK